ncbi:MAG TPA: ABC transporter permease [Blastocatellia bacterium]|nr:ABC transporter permease [Blastocatellia bacterium]
MLSRLKTAVRALLRRSQAEGQLDEELRYHIERQTEQNMRMGMNPEEARFAALKAFGGVEQAKERSRDARGARWIEELWQDLRYGARMLVKNPGFTLTAVITLALGIGANTAIFSVVNAVLINPFPYPAGNRLTTLYTTHDQPPGMLPTDLISAGIFADWRAEQQSFSEMFAFTASYARLTGTKEADFLPGFSATARFFETLGVKPVLGRGFLAEEEIPGRPKVVVISHALWRDRLDTDPNVIGKTLRLNGAEHTIIGVLPQDFKFIYQIDLLFPFELNPNDRDNGLAVIGRLKDGVTLEQARVETRLITKRLRQADSRPGDNPSGGANLVPLGKLTGGDTRRALWILFSATSFVLLIACANLANLLTARAAGRQREIAIRAALGAGRRRLIFQMMAESLLLAAMGGMVGILMAWWSIDWLTSLAPADLTISHQIEIDASVFGFTLLSVAVTAALFGLAPAWQASKPNLTQSLKIGTGFENGGRRSFNFRSLLIVGEVALAMVLLTGAGLLINSLVRLIRVHPGFAPENTLAVDVMLSDSYKKREQKIDFYQRTTGRLAAIPGVEAVATINLLPFGEMLLHNIFLIDGRPESPDYEAYTPTISANYFDFMRIPILKGRNFFATDTEKTPGVAVISESCSRRYFADSDPIGQRISFNSAPDGKPIWLEIVGVTGDVKQQQLNDDAVPTIYFPFSQAQGFRLGGVFVLRSSIAPEGLVATVRKELRAIDPESAIYRPNTLSALIAETTKGRRFNTFLLSVMATLAIGLAAVGLYGVMSYLVAHRTREIGIRMALGAQSGDVLGLMVRQGMAPVVLGLIIGFAAAIALTRLMKSILFEVSATDPLTFALSATLLILAALLANWLPTRRATKVDPLIALRSE